eukprot:c5564_g1_i1.p1 GENE.c5564_g1_i1~~c5564_g1_i1.p1  ORF type:complete len:120 (+),score=8.39 c5564_g1_i1:25-384(+)
MLPKGLTIQGFLIVEILVSIALFITLLLALGKCYSSPCLETSGLDMLWSVHAGESFQMFLTAVFCMIHGVITFHAIFRCAYHGQVYGMVLALSVGMSVWLLVQVIDFAQASSLLAGTFD